MHSLAAQLAILIYHMAQDRDAQYGMTLPLLCDDDDELWDLIWLSTRTAAFSGFLVTNASTMKPDPSSPS